jgi:hypothetical protein
MLRIPHCLDNRLIDGGKVVCSTHPQHPPHFTPQKQYYFNVSGTHFCRIRAKKKVDIYPRLVRNIWKQRITGMLNLRLWHRGRLQSSGFWHYVFQHKFTDVSGGNTGSVFSIVSFLVTIFLVIFLARFSILKTEILCYSETSMDIYRNTLWYNL